MDWEHIYLNYSDRILYKIYKDTKNPFDDKERKLNQK